MLLQFDWAKELPIPVTITDAEGIIIYMNDASIEAFREEGGAKLIGTNVNLYHNEYSQSVIQRISHEHTPNIYTIEKRGKKTLIYQAPFYNVGKYAGLVEISIDLPEILPNVIREK